MNKKYVYQNKWLKIREDTTPTDKEFIYSIVERTDGVVIIPLSPSKRTLLLKEFRYPINTTVWSLPMGGVDEGELLEKTALRELTEETSIIAKSCHQIGSFYPAAGLTTQKAYVYVVPISEKDLESAENSILEENIKEIKVVTMDQINKNIENGEIKEGFTLSSLLLLHHYLKQS